MCKFPLDTGAIYYHSSLALIRIHILGGVVDSDYIGETKVTMQNLGPEPMVCSMNSKIAQTVVTKGLVRDAEQMSEPSAIVTKHSGFGH